MHKLAEHTGWAPARVRETFLEAEIPAEDERRAAQLLHNNSVFFLHFSARISSVYVLRTELKLLTDAHVVIRNGVEKEERGNIYEECRKYRKCSWKRKIITPFPIYINY